LVHIQDLLQVKAAKWE